MMDLIRNHLGREAEIKRENEDISFLREHDGETPICLKSREYKDGDGPVKHGFCIKLGADEFEVYDTPIHDGNLNNIGKKSAPEIIKDWWID